MAFGAWAARGLTGPHRLFEGKRSLGTLLYHDKTPDLSKMLDGLGSHYMIEEIAFKAFAACRSVQPTVTAVLELLNREHFTVEDIASVDVETYPFAVELSNESSLETPISARLSIPYAVAIALQTGDLGLRAFLPNALVDPQTRELAGRVHVRSVEGYGRGPFGTRGSIVTLNLKNNVKLHAETLHTRWDKELPPSDHDLEMKFRELAGLALTPTTVDQLVQSI